MAEQKDKGTQHHRVSEMKDMTSDFEKRCLVDTFDSHLVHGVDQQLQKVPISNNNRVGVLKN